MFNVLGFMIIGVILGYILKNHRVPYINQFINVQICLLLFILGIEIGSNPNIVKDLKLIGIDAIVISLGAILGSILIAWIFWEKINRKK
jgi:uncharacterized membrane protein YbjE (DUF340 family)